MEIIADKGNGNYAYIDNLQEARRVLVREFGGTLFTIAKDVKFQIEFNPARVESYRLIGYENRLLNDEDFNDDKKDAGEMGSGHNVTALYEIVPAGSDEERPSVDPLRYQRNETVESHNDDYAYQQNKEYQSNKEYLNIKIRYKKPDGKTSMLLEKPVKGGVKEIGYASENMRFAAAISEFGMILRSSEFKGNSTLQDAIDLAGGARGEDEEGYRAEAIRLMKTVRDLKLTSERE
jgi:Ca-activated chloride channel family protein